LDDAVRGRPAHARHRPRAAGERRADEL